METIAERIRDFHRANAAEWRQVEASGAAERSAAFYEGSQHYVYDLLSGNTSPAAVVEKLNQFDPLLLQSIQRHPGRNFLEFGGGLGVVCEIVARMGKQVHYLDIPGLVSRFAVWRFERLGLNIPFLCAQPDRIEIPGTYDVVFTDAVLEHLPPPLQLDAARALGAAVATDGLLIFLVDLSGPDEDFPMHHHVDIRALHGALEASGLRCESGRETFCSRWRRG
ncbi:MAG: class I SAM-dependent methyltransferase [Candidatus Eisenbacteria bacterium]|uniref:Class I SAM-dependent methyltransferase n=1 Tax=Eiseniibacteriota bacterium TaxID=2212470 RepID=A0A933SC60_UNCEI|nr:class I SAM-dependent methyltransferase [Candidatus Eisenbacteria bacterium]